VANAHADVITTTKAEAHFTCNSDDCSGGTLDHVSNGEYLVPEGSDFPGNHRKIGPWSRTVTIKCKATKNLGNRGWGTAYGVTVYDKTRGPDWTGTWSVFGDFLTQPIDDSQIPTCSYRVYVNNLEYDGS